MISPNRTKDSMPTIKLSDEHSMALPNGLLDKVTERTRSKIHSLFLNHVNPTQSDIILDIGASANPTFKASNYLEATSPHLNISAVGLGADNPIWQKLYPNIPYTHGTVLALPFDDKSFDIVYSHAVIEHVGCYANQVKMIIEALRVAKKSIWITTPNRWHPIEFHSVFPFFHWLPKSWYRFILKKMGSTYFCKEENLNLLGKKSLLSATKNAELACSDFLKSPLNIRIYTVRFLGFTSNLLLHIKI